MRHGRLTGHRTQLGPDSGTASGQQTRDPFVAELNHLDRGAGGPQDLFRLCAKWRECVGINQYWRAADVFVDGCADGGFVVRSGLERCLEFVERL